MKTITEQYAMISLNGEEKNSRSVIMKRKQYCMIAGIILEDVLNQAEGTKGHFMNEELQKIYASLGNDRSLNALICDAQKIPRKVREDVCFNIIEKMISEGYIVEVPSLLECDINYEMSNIEVKQYKTPNKLYLSTSEYIKAETLEGENIPRDVAFVLWLLKQSDDLSNIFSKSEIDKVEEQLIKLYKEDTLLHELFGASIEVKGAKAKGMLDEIRRNTIYTQRGIGLVSKIPFLEKKESIFISTDKYFANAYERLAIVKDKVISKGHECEVKTIGEVPVLEIDNILYELIPDAVKVRYLNVHGVRLRRFIL